MDRNGTWLIQWQCQSPASSVPWQEWAFDAVGSNTNDAFDGTETYNYFVIKNLDTGQVIDVPSGSSAGTQLDLADSQSYNAGSNNAPSWGPVKRQMWKVDG